MARSETWKVRNSVKLSEGQGSAEISRSAFLDLEKELRAKLLLSFHVGIQVEAKVMNKPS